MRVTRNRREACGARDCGQFANVPSGVVIHRLECINPLLLVPCSQPPRTVEYKGITLTEQTVHAHLAQSRSSRQMFNSDNVYAVTTKKRFSYLQKRATRNARWHPGTPLLLLL